MGQVISIINKIFECICPHSCHVKSSCCGADFDGEFSHEDKEEQDTSFSCSISNCCTLNRTKTTPYHNG